MSYSGPPPSTPPPPDWRPPVVFRQEAPRTLPPQDHAALDAAERTARRVTWAVASVAGAVALLVVCFLFGRLVS